MTAKHVNRTRSAKGACTPARAVEAAEGCRVEVEAAQGLEEPVPRRGVGDGGAAWAGPMAVATAEDLASVDARVCEIERRLFVCEEAGRHFGDRQAGLYAAMCGRMADGDRKARLIGAACDLALLAVCLLLLAARG